MIARTHGHSTTIGHLAPSRTVFRMEASRPHHHHHRPNAHRVMKGAPNVASAVNGVSVSRDPIVVSDKAQTETLRERIHAAAAVASDVRTKANLQDRPSSALLPRR